MTSDNRSALPGLARAMLAIREYRESDWPEAWPILQEIVRAGDTYTFSPQSTEEEIRKAWIEVPAKTFIACDSEGRVLGTYFIKANQPGLGAHVCNCGYVVPRTMQGRGIASLMCEHSQAQALAWDSRRCSSISLFPQTHVLFDSGSD